MDDLRIESVTPDRWPDLLALFGDNGAYSNCWCTWWMLTGKEWDATSPPDRRSLLQTTVAAGDEPGLLAYRDGEPIGWCAVGPRSRYDRMMSPHSRVYRPLDDIPTWMINCFFIRKGHRGAGVATALLDAAIGFATDHGAQILEGYPIDRSTRQPGASGLFVGTLAMFLDAGFVEVSRTGDRPLVRCTLARSS